MDGTNWKRSLDEIPPFETPVLVYGEGTYAIAELHHTPDGMEWRDTVFGAEIDPDYCEFWQYLPPVPVYVPGQGVGTVSGS